MLNCSAAALLNPKGQIIREGRRIRRDEFGMGSYIIAFEEECRLCQGCGTDRGRY
ncbi:MAG: hypothetical protein ACLR2E_03730 [Lachnospiraceae bacterium]